MLSPGLLPGSAYVTGSRAPNPSLTRHTLHGCRGLVSTLRLNLVTPVSPHKSENPKDSALAEDQGGPKADLGSGSYYGEREPHAVQGLYPTLVLLSCASRRETISSTHTTAGCSGILSRSSCGAGVGPGLLVWDALRGRTDRHGGGPGHHPPSHFHLLAATTYDSPRVPEISSQG